MVRLSRQQRPPVRRRRTTADLANALAAHIESDRYQLTYLGFALYVFDRQEGIYRSLKLHMRESLAAPHA